MSVLSVEPYTAEEARQVADACEASSSPRPRTAATLRAYAEMMERQYAPQDVVAHCLEVLDAAGMGKPGMGGNTLWAMTDQIAAKVDEQANRIAALEAENAELIRQRSGGEFNRFVLGHPRPIHGPLDHTPRCTTGGCRD